MAIVPTRDITQVTRTRPVSPVFLTGGATPAAFGGQQAAATRRAGQFLAQGGTAIANAQAQLGQSVSDVGLAVAAIYKREKKENDTDAAKRALVRLKEKITERTLGEDGTFTYKGQKALDDINPTVDYIKKIKEELRNELPSRDSQIMFDISASLHIDNTMESLGKFRIRERQQRDLDTSKATVESALGSIANAAGSPQAFHDNMTILGQEAANVGRLQGLSGPSQERLSTQYHSEGLKSAVTAAIKNGRPDIASDILEGKGDYKLPGNIKIDGNVRAELTKLVSTADNLEQSQKIVDEVIARFPDDEKARLKYIEENYKGTIEKGAKDELRRRQEDDNRARRREYYAANAVLIRAVDKGEVKSLADAVRKFPEDYTAFIAGGGNPDYLLRLIVSVDKGQTNPLVMDPKKRLEADQILSGKIDAKTVMGLTPEYVRANYTREVAEKIFNKQETYQRRLDSAPAARAVQNQIYRTIRKMSSRSLSPRPRKNGEGYIIDTEQFLNDEQQALVAREVENFVSQYKREEKEYPKPQDVENEAARIIMSLVATSDPPGFWDPENRAWDESMKFIKEASPRRRAFATVEFSKIPPIIRQKLRRIIESKGGRWSEALGEQMAGAYAADDDARLARLIKESQEKTPIEKFREEIFFPY